jgi:hypothetical protein
VFEMLTVNDTLATVGWNRSRIPIAGASEWWHVVLYSFPED